MSIINLNDREYIKILRQGGREVETRTRDIRAVHQTKPWNQLIVRKDCKIINICKSRLPIMEKTQSQIVWCEEGHQ